MIIRHPTTRYLGPAVTEWQDTVLAPSNHWQEAAAIAASVLLPQLITGIMLWAIL